MDKSWWALEEVTQRMWPLDDLRVRPGQSEAPYPLPCPWDVCSAHGSHSGSHFQGYSLERAMSCWDHLDWIHDWIQGRSPYKLLTFWWWVGRSIHLAALRQALYMSTLLIQPSTYQSGVVCLSSVSPCPPCKGANLQSNGDVIEFSLYFEIHQ